MPATTTDRMRLLADAVVRLGGAREPARFRSVGRPSDHRPEDVERLRACAKPFAKKDCHAWSPRTVEVLRRIRRLGASTSTPAEIDDAFGALESALRGDLAALATGLEARGQTLVESAGGAFGFLKKVSKRGITRAEREQLDRRIAAAERKANLRDDAGATAREALDGLVEVAQGREMMEWFYGAGGAAARAYFAPVDGKKRKRE